jgi:hypothetical protein
MSVLETFGVCSTHTFLTKALLVLMVSMLLFQRGGESSTLSWCSMKFLEFNNVEFGEEIKVYSTGVSMKIMRKSRKYILLRSVLFNPVADLNLTPGQFKILGFVKK